MLIWINVNLWLSGKLISSFNKYMLNSYLLVIGIKSYLFCLSSLNEKVVSEIVALIQIHHFLCRDSNPQVQQFGSKHLNSEFIPNECFKSLLAFLDIFAVSCMIILVCLVLNFCGRK